VSKAEVVCPHLFTLSAEPLCYVVFHVGHHNNEVICFHLN